MLQKIRYRLVHNYAGKLNRQGLAPVALECRQGANKVYFSSKVLIGPGQWAKGAVVNHDNAEKLTVYLVRWKNEIEEIELDALLRGKHLTLYQLKEAVKTGLRSNATIREFSEAVISRSDRKKETKRSYQYLCNEIEKEYGRLTLDDITHDWIEKFRTKMRNQQLSDNTIKGRLKALRCLINEALKRNLITDDPFKYITIGNMSARVGYLEADEVRRLERLNLKGKEAKVRDLFLLSCYTGLRWSDLSTLEEADISNGMLHKTMKKTSFDVHIPVDTLFWGKGQDIINRYPDIKALSHVCCNTQANRILKDLAVKAVITKRIYMHLGRKTCSNMLNALGMSIQDISSILGHTKVEVTQKHYLFNNSEHLKTSVSAIFQNKSKTTKKRAGKMR